MARLTDYFPYCGYAPLVPVALAFTAGIVVDRYLSIPIQISSLAAFGCLAAFLLGLGSRRQRANTEIGVPSNSSRTLIALWAAIAALGAVYHHYWRNQFTDDDIGNWTRERAYLVHVQGTLDEEPVRIYRQRNDPLVSLRPKDPSSAILVVTAIEQEGTWIPASGKARFYVDGELADLHSGDEIECVGWLARPETPANPGEWDRAGVLQDQRIRAEIRVRKTADGVVRIAAGWRSSLFGWLAVIRGWGQRALQTELPPETSGVAGALLLGEGSTMTREDWEKYIRTGVIHVLAISGQHLVLLAMFFWVVVRVLGIRRRRAALVIAALVLAYALLTGGRPSAMRAAVMVCTVSLGIMLRKPVLKANSFALAWIIVLALQPTDLFTSGFQLSFLAVAVLIWGMPHWFPPREPAPLDQLVDESRPTIVRIFWSIMRGIAHWYLITLVLGIALAPQVMYWQNLISLAGFLIGPPLIFFTSIALLAGFLLLFISIVSSWLALPFAWVTSQCIAICEWIVLQVDALPISHVYVGQIAEWWLIGFYLIGIAWLARPFLGVGEASPLRALPQRGTSWLAALGVWTCLGVLSASIRPTPDELRVTFVAVGHGGCMVLETPDGRTILYDAGSMSGSETTRRHIAPFLWSRQIRGIDEVFLSHADLDHFNGLPALLDRFTIGQVTVTPSFFDKNQPGVKVVQELLARRAIPIRIAQSGDIFQAGEVEFTVLHPPPDGIPGPDENPRSLVLLVQHRKRKILLTGDLTGVGLQRVLTLPKMNIDVLMAPHHGSSSSNTPGLLAWASPKLAVVCEELREEPTAGEKAYQDRKIPLWSTAAHGAITLHSHRTGLVLETFKTKQRLVVRDGGER
jgi:competence protein ComEC